jgi:predicted RecA/RadA family phage recombinase
MSVIEQYSGNQFPQMLAGTIGSAGDIVYVSTGSLLTHKTAANGTGVTNKFLGIAVNDFVAGSYVAVVSEGVVELTKHVSTNKIEVGDRIYGTKSSNKVGTLAGGTCLGICVKQSSTSDTYVSVKLLPFYYSPGA